MVSVEMNTLAQRIIDTLVSRVGDDDCCVNSYLRQYNIK